MTGSNVVLASGEVAQRVVVYNAPNAEQSADSPAFAAGAATAALQGALTETAPATDTASSGQNGRLQRIAQRLTSLLAGGFTGPATSTPSSVDSVTTAGGVTISAGAAANRGRIINNTDANPLYLYFGANGTVTSAIYHIALNSGQQLILQPGEYTGNISGIWGANGSGTAYVAEFTS